MFSVNVWKNENTVIKSDTNDTECQNEHLSSIAHTNETANTLTWNSNHQTLWEASS